MNVAATALDGSRLLTGLALVLLAAAVPTFLLGSLDSRTVDAQVLAANVWAKPLKFQLSLALQMLTVAWALGFMRRGVAPIPGQRLLTIALLVAVLFEVVYITVQGARGVPSHFNRATPIENLGAGLMAAGANVLVGASAWVGAVALWRWWRAESGAREPMLLAIGIGFVAMFLLAGFTGAAMGQHRGPFVEAAVQTGRAMPLTGWRFDIGDLRISHFFGVHAMQAIPVAAWLVRRAPRPLAHAWVAVAGLAWIGVTLALMQWALANRGWPA